MKAQNEGTSLILIAPDWPTQNYWPMLQLYARDRMKLKNNSSLLSGPMGEPHPLILSGSLSLSAWLI